MLEADETMPADGSFVVSRSRDTARMGKKSTLKFHRNNKDLFGKLELLTILLKSYEEIPHGATVFDIEVTRDRVNKPEECFMRD